MIRVNLPDGSKLNYEAPPSLEGVATDIGTGLGRACVCGRIDDQLVDASEPVGDGQSVQVLTAKDPEGLEVVRHSCAHLLAHAVKQLWPEARMAIGPVIEDGFYYDIDMPHVLTPDDLTTIEERMLELAKTDYPVQREVVSRDRAMQTFKERQEPYKREIVADIPDGDTIALYHHREYTDMCRGPHVTNTRHLRHFHLTHLAGAYWRGDSDRPMLQRIYGTAWASAGELKAHLQQREQARLRDHRLIGREMGLYHFQEEAPGMAFWHPDGFRLYRRIESYIRELTSRHGYLEIRTPQLLDMKLWEESGHAEKFADAMFLTGSEKRTYAIKPMNCPGHVQVFKRRVQSYRELPLRLAEFGQLHRNEPSGTLHGLMRVRTMVQDDAHLFCTPEQMHGEISTTIDLAYEVYDRFGFARKDIEVALSTRPEERLGDDALWDNSEKTLAAALQEKGLAYHTQEGEGAFYGPKIEFTLRDCMKRAWQCGTVQLDFVLPERLDASYSDANDQPCRPVMVHRALLGSLERFIGILLEHYAGRLPLWLSPQHAVILSIAERHRPYCLEAAETLKKAGLRVQTDLRNERVGYKIRDHHQMRIPYMIIIGDKEVEQRTLSVRAAEQPHYQLSLSDNPTAEEFCAAVAALMRP